MELKLEGLKKSYTKGKTYTVQDFSYCFTPGVYGLLGPNGTGKKHVDEYDNPESFPRSWQDYTEWSGHLATGGILSEPVGVYAAAARTVR